MQLFLASGGVFTVFQKQVTASFICSLILFASDPRLQHRGKWSEDGYEPWIKIKHPNAMSVPLRYTGMLLIRGAKVVPRHA